MKVEIIVVAIIVVIIINVIDTVMSPWPAAASAIAASATAASAAAASVSAAASATGSAGATTAAELAKSACLVGSMTEFNQRQGHRAQSADRDESQSCPSGSPGTARGTVVAQLSATRRASKGTGMLLCHFFGRPKTA